MEKDKKEVRMVAAVSEALEFRKRNPNVDSEKILSHIINLVAKEKEQDIKLGMIAAASKAVFILERNPNMHERMIIKQVMKEFPDIIAGIDKE
jgi:hypothetical protein